MLKGAIIGLIILAGGDMALNDGRYTHIAWAKVSSFAIASRHAVGDSIFGR